MNCDGVFDILTRGPFPTGTDCDERVERHLLVCPDCRRLAAALQPAIELFEEAITPEESRDLPGYWGELFANEADHFTPPVQQASRVAAVKRLSSRLRADAATTYWSGFCRLAAAVLLGVCIGGMLRGASVRQARHPDALPEPVAAAMVATDDSDEGGHLVEHAVAEASPAPRSLIRSLGLATACLKTGSWEPAAFTIHLESDMPNLLAHVELSALSCCTQCHASGNNRAAASVASNVMQSCVLCHAH